MNGMITTNESYNLDEIIPKLKEYTTGKVVERVTCEEKHVLKEMVQKLHCLTLVQKKTSQNP